MRTILFALMLSISSSLSAGDLPLPMAAKLLHIISKGAGEGGRVATKHEDMAEELAKAGAEVNASARIAWTTEMGQVRMLSMQKKCVVVNDPKFFGMGAALALYEEGGKVKIAINQRAVTASGVALSDAILKAAMQ